MNISPGEHGGIASGSPQQHGGAQRALQKAETIVENELDAIGNLTMQFHIDAFANRLGTYADQICQEEIQKLFEALLDLNAHQREIIETQMVRLSQRIILAPGETSASRTVYANARTPSSVWWTYSVRIVDLEVQPDRHHGEGDPCLIHLYPQKPKFN